MRFIRLGFTYDVSVRLDWYLFQWKRGLRVKSSPNFAAVHLRTCYNSNKDILFKNGFYWFSN